MNKSAIRSVVQAVCLIAVLAALAIPLSGLMVGQTSATSSAVPGSTSVDLDQSPDGSSAVSALMAGSAVGPSRGGSLNPRNPATAYQP